MGLAAPRGRLAAFTLIELLVVVAIIALLVSILLPSLRNAKREGKRVKCGAQLKQLVTGFRMYADEDRGQAPLPNWGWPRYDENLHRGWLFNPGEMKNVGRPAFRWREEDLQLGVLWPYALSADLYRCPEHIRGDRWENDSRRITSYLANGSIGGFVRDVSYKYELFPVNAVILWEPPDPETLDEDETGFVAEDWQDGSSTPDQGFSFRHGNRGATLAIMDGHVEWWSYNKYRDELVVPFKNALWYHPKYDHGRWDGWTP